MEEHILTIFSAEDDDQHSIERAIKKSGIGATINFVSNGQALIEKLTEQYGVNLPDILLLDLNVPIVDGLEVLRLLRERDDIDDLPVIILTTSSNQEDIDKCYSLGAKSFITKLSSFSELAEVVKSLSDFKE